MTLIQYRTTKIPASYFNQIEQHLRHASEFVSVSEFIRDSIREKLSRARNMQLEQRYFLLVKDLVFNDQRLQMIHKVVMNLGGDTKAGMLKKVSLQNLVDRSLHLDYRLFLARFIVNFAYVHPFEDGNKRTSWTAVDVFLRLNYKKLLLKANKSRETRDETFIWQNSANQKSVEQVVSFLEKHIIDYDSTSDLDRELAQSVKENQLLLKKLSR
jgi:prophage maintenance system killer protein